MRLSRCDLTDRFELVGARTREIDLAGSRLAGIWADRAVVEGYGYRPTLAALWLVALAAVGTAVFTAVPPTPLNPASPVRFRAPVYTVDLLLPLVDLRQESAFEPVGETVWVAYALMACGLVLVTTIAAGTTRALRRT
ncbi:hypothetical protein [Micromonospora sp. KC213]|uniref:hypothetical protein n=1 Tax=Micromonospora sp. KC213 TaxID=2530378 RepID=UPI00104B4180|nr:hypothetical protein [Micromonospora sp. KC213]TDC41396.1 hypothetical protein E1166_11760 [Micromonospora sp. KC213]